MTMRTRKLIGTFVFLFGITVYAFVAMLVSTIVEDAHWALELLYFTIAGIVWVAPAAILIRWMQRPDGPATDMPAE
ncbi:MAG: DUF2842 domain-containing protein [Pseudomonadota bacterium]